MPQNPGWLTRDELRRILRSAGFRISNAQLERWHKSGLIDRPQKEYLGRGRGTVSRYPPFAPTQTLAVAFLRRHCRDLELVGWYLWCLGFPRTALARAYLRRHLKRLLEETEESFAALERSDPKNPFDRARKARLPSHLQGIRRVVGTDFMPVLVRLWAELDVGKTDALYGLRSEDVRRLLGLARHFGLPTSSRVASNRKELVGALSILTTVASRHAGEISIPATVRALELTKDQGLEQIRDEVQTLIPVALASSGKALLEILVPPHLYIAYFQARCVSRTLAPRVHKSLSEAARVGAIPLPRPPLLARAALAARNRGHDQRTRSERSLFPLSGRP